MDRAFARGQSGANRVNTERRREQRKRRVSVRSSAPSAPSAFSAPSVFMPFAIGRSQEIRLRSGMSEASPLFSRCCVMRVADEDGEREIAR